MEDLLKTRFKVVADYPLCQFQVGDILMQKGHRKGFYSTLDQSHGIMLADILKYPHLFRKLEWWEHRDKDEMPKYVKWIGSESNICVSLIDRWDMVHFIGWGINGFGCSLSSENANYHIPATKKEYILCKLKQMNKQDYSFKIDDFTVFYQTENLGILPAMNEKRYYDVMGSEGIEGEYMTAGEAADYIINQNKSN